MLDTPFAPAALPDHGAFALLLRQDHPHGPLFDAADQRCGGALSRALAPAAFTGKKGQSCVVLGATDAHPRIVLIGLGPDPVLRAYEEAGAAAALALSREETASLGINGTAADAAHAALGAQLRTYRFDRYRTKEAADDKPRLTTLTILTAEHGVAHTAHAPLAAARDGVFLARDLASEPPNVLYPAELADRCTALEQLGVTVDILDEAALTAAGFGAILAVAQGSARGARVVVMHWHGADGAPVALIGKGVTFDTGGISIKPAPGMEDMKWDMAGAAAVIGTLHTLAARKARVNAVGIVGLVENMPSGTAMRPGDVIRSLSGQTIEVQNTDAEGRLVLADLVWYAQERFAPRVSIDLATLTGAIIVALGHEHAGLFSNNDELATQLLAAGTASGEGLWRMPLGEAYDKLIRSDIADMKNIGGRPGGSIIGAQFVQRFVRGPWAHLDIAGMAWATKDSALAPKGATAFGVRLLNQLIAKHFES